MAVLQGQAASDAPRLVMAINKVDLLPSQATSLRVQARLCFSQKAQCRPLLCQMLCLLVRADAPLVVSSCGLSGADGCLCVRACSQHIAIDTVSRLQSLPGGGALAWACNAAQAWVQRRAFPMACCIMLHCLWYALSYRRGRYGGPSTSLVQYATFLATVRHILAAVPHDAWYAVSYRHGRGGGRARAASRSRTGWRWSARPAAPAWGAYCACCTRRWPVAAMSGWCTPRTPCR